MMTLGNIIIVNFIITFLIWLLLLKMIKLEYPNYSYWRALIFIIDEFLYEDFYITMIGFSLFFIVPLIPLCNILYLFCLLLIYIKSRKNPAEEYINYEYEYKKLVKILIKQNKLTIEQINDLKISSELMDEILK